MFFKYSSCDLLHRMNIQFESQKGKQKKGFRYEDPVLENFAIMTRIIGGRRMYEILSDNLIGVFPCARTIGKKSRLSKSQL